MTLRSSSLVCLELSVFLVITAQQQTVALERMQRRVTEMISSVE